jgi:hypothetical protein
MSISENDTQVAAVRLTTMYVYRWGLIPLLIFGTVGNVINLIILRHNKFRTCSSCFYLFGATVASCVIIPFSILRRLLLEGYDVDLYETRYLWWCRTRYFISHATFFVAAHLLVLSSLDRYLRSFRQMKYRRWCTMPVARRITVGIVIIITVVSSHVLVFFKIENNECYAYGAHRLYMELSFLIGQCLFTILGMCTLGLLVVRKARQQLNRRNLHSYRAKRLRQFRRTICIQTVCLCILLLPRSGHKVYVAINLVRYTSIQYGTLNHAHERLITAIVSVLEFASWSLLFYFYSLASHNIRSHV